MRYVDLVGDSELVQPGVFGRAVLGGYVVELLDVVDMLGMDTRIVVGRVVGGRDDYKVVVQFSGVSGGISEGSGVLVRCSCPSFRFWFGEADRRAGVLFGRKMKRYVPVPDNLLVRGRPGPKNPGMIPGCCKHVMVLMKYLKSVGFIGLLYNKRVGGNYEIC